MDKNEARQFLEKSKYINGIEQEGIIYFYKIGLFYREYKNEYSFICYPYTSKEPEIIYDYAFEAFVSKNSGSVSFANAPFLPIELRRIEKANGLNNILPKEDVIVSINDAENAINNSRIIIGEKRHGIEYNGIIYYYKLGQFFIEYEEYYSFFGYPYTSKDKTIDFNNKYELFVEKWRGRIAISSEKLIEHDLKQKDRNSIIEKCLEWIDPNYDSIRYGGVEKLKIIKYGLYVA